MDGTSGLECAEDLDMVLMVLGNASARGFAGLTGDNEWGSEKQRTKMAFLISTAAILLQRLMEEVDSLGVSSQTDLLREPEGMVFLSVLYAKIERP
uniref:Uncharacterized protein n=1 Tax=Parascaris equorum TaxID=6256 RepID=A0A914RQI5_PAREQ